MKADTKIVVLTTVGSEEMALEIAQELVEGHSAACVNIAFGLRSVYRWEGKVVDDREALLLIKTRLDCFEQVEKTIMEIIDYECPEIIALPVVDGAKKFLAWVDSCVEAEGDSD